MSAVAISDHEFGQFRRFIFERAGITLSPSKKALVSGRLANRLAHCKLDSYGKYFKLLSSGEAPGEMQVAIDLLTTNETYFFREAKHFDVLKAFAREQHSAVNPFRVWSAASSTGEEAYSIAMTLADCLGGNPWEVVGTDISTRVLARARKGHYPMERARNVSHDFLRRFCLKGNGPQHGTLLVSRELRERVRFLHANLNEPLTQLGSFDIVFLRNVLIYFNNDTKQQVVRRVAGSLRRGGLLMVGHSESLNGIDTGLVPHGMSIYMKP